MNWQGKKEAGTFTKLSKYIKTIISDVECVTHCSVSCLKSFGLLTLI